MRPGVLLDQVDRLLGHDPDPRRVRRDQELANLRSIWATSRHHEQHAALGTGLDAVFRAVDAITGVDRGGGNGRIHRRPAPARLTDRPGRDRFPRHQRLDRCGVGLPVRAAGQGREHDADRVQRSGRHRPAELLGDHGQIGQAAVRDAAAAQLLRNEQTRPAELRSALPPCRIKGLTRGMQLPDAPQRRFFLQKGLGGGGEEYLFGRVDSGHDAGGIFSGSRSLLRKTRGRRLGWLIIRLIGPGCCCSLATPMLATRNTVRDTGVPSIMILTSGERDG